jgi:hypothetical protein
LSGEKIVVPVGNGWIILSHPTHSKVIMLTTLSKNPHANKCNYTEGKTFNHPHNSIQNRAPKFLLCIELTLIENVG